MSRPRLLFYCQHSVGLGHLVRSFALCRGLAERFEVVLACGGSLPRGIAAPESVSLVTLPPLGVGPDGRFVSHDPALTVEEATERRRALLVETLREVRPDVVLVELFPFGRAKFARELLPFLAEAWSLRPRRPFVACSLRDILVTGRRNQAAHDERASEIANRWFDAVLVHAERRFAPLEASFRPRTPLAVPVHYTGYVVPNGHRPAADPPAHAGRVVVSAGGGLVGAPLLRAALGAHRMLWPAERRAMTLIAGPFLPEPAWRALRAEAEACEGVEVRRSVPDLGEALRGAAASVSQCGYNTALEVLRARLPALVVPYATPQEDEQLRRARLLEAMGALRVLVPERLTAAALAQELRALATFAPARAPLDLDGARRTPALLARLAAAGADPVADPAVAMGVAAPEECSA